jgi:aldehyde dehydrogenase (NAD+)
MTKRMRAGVIWANTFNKFDPSSPFGGYKESGYWKRGWIAWFITLFELKPPVPLKGRLRLNISFL